MGRTRTTSEAHEGSRQSDAEESSSSDPRDTEGGEQSDASSASDLSSLSDDSLQTNGSGSEDYPRRAWKRKSKPRPRQSNGKKARSGLNQGGLLAARSKASQWSSREHNFDKFRSSFIVLPVPEGITRIEKARGFSLFVPTVVSWIVPDSLLSTQSRKVRNNNRKASNCDDAQDDGDGDDDDDDEGTLLTVGIHMSLFHATSKRFFGNTWVSPEVPVDVYSLKPEREPNSNALRYVIDNVALSFRAYFLSEIVDQNCVGIVELVAYCKDPDSKATIASAGCGWTILPLFAHSNGDKKQLPTPFTAGMASSGESVGVFTRSPRVLWELQGPSDWQTQPRHAQSKFYYQLQLYEPLEALGTGGFLRRNELVGALEVIPGLKHGNLAAIDAGTNPKLQLLRDADRSSNASDEDDTDDDLTAYEESLQSFVRMAALVPKTIQFEESFTLNIQALRVFLHLRSEVEANLISRLKLSRRTIHNGATSIDDGHVSARVLKIALHNGRCFRTRQHTIPLKVEGGDTSGDDVLRCASSAPARLKGFVFHPFMAVVVILQFTVHFRVTWPPKLKQQAMEATPKRILPEDDVFTVAIASRVVVPSDGKRLFLYDKEQPATDNAAVHPDGQRVLHVDLLSGPACRPYTDSPVYTPPDHVFAAGRSAQIKMRESIAFADITLMVDGVEEKSAGVKEQATISKKQPPPAAAEHWAQKILAKADANSVLAQTLNALAKTQPAALQQQEQPTSPVRPPSPQKSVVKAVAKPARQDPVPAALPAPELSRASKALLMRHGFVDAHDTSPVQASHSPGTVSVSPQKMIRVELEDIYKAHEIRLHFAAFRLVPISPIASIVPQKVYLTFQFYRFSPTRTETLRLSNAFASRNGVQNQPPTFLLMRENPTNKPSLAIQFDVDTTETLNPLEPHNFASYLLHKQLYVDVWDADTLFLLGTCAIPLHELLRQGAGVKKYQGEVDVIENNSVHDDATKPSSATVVDSDEARAIQLMAVRRGGGTVIGKLQVLLSNYGLKGKHVLNSTSSHQIASKEEQRGPAPASIAALKTKHRVRARPLVDGNTELHRLLASEGFYGADQSRNQSHQQRRQRLDARSAGDATTLTPKEIDILCELFRSAPSQSAPNATQIACDTEARRGLTALLSLRPPAMVSTKPNAQTPAVSTSQGPSIVQARDPVTQLREHLKRVLERAADKGVRIHQVFQDFDASGDGNLSYDELQRALEQLGFKVATQDGQGTLRDLLRQIDRDGNGSISYEEFLVSLGISIEQNVKEVVAASVVDMETVARQVFQRLETQGIDVEELFDHFDSDKSGQLDMLELKNALEKCLQTGQSSDHKNLLELLKEDALRELMRRVNKNGDAVVDYHEFLAFCGVAVKTPREREALKKQRMRTQAESKLLKLLLRAMELGMTASTLFQQFDNNADGDITVKEFASSLDSLFQTKDSLNTEDIQAISRRFDADGDGKISFGEFKAFVDEIRQAHALIIDVFKPLEVKMKASGEQLMRLPQFRAMCLQQWKLAKPQVESVVVALTTIDLVDSSQCVRLEDLLLAVNPPPSQAATTQRKPPLEHKEIGARLREFLTLAAKQGVDAQACFSHFDPDGDGLITAQELKSALHQLGQMFADVTDDAIEAMVDELDTDKSGKVSFSEFEKVMPKTAVSKAPADNTKETKNPTSVEGVLTWLKDLLSTAASKGLDIESCFSHFDKDASGKVTRDEFAQAMSELGLKIDEKQKRDVTDLINQVMDVIDKDRSGEISLAEFKKLFPSTAAHDTGSKRNQQPTAESAASVPTKQEQPKSTVDSLRELLQAALNGGVSIDQSFGHFDVDGDGSITRDEFKTMLKALPGFEDVAEADILRVVDALDANKRGSVTKDEFTAFINADKTSIGPEPPLGVKIAATVAGDSMTSTILDSKSEMATAPEGDASLPTETSSPPVNDATETSTKSAPIRRAGSFGGKEQAKPAVAAARRPSLAETRAAVKAAMKAKAASDNEAKGAEGGAVASDQPAKEESTAGSTEPPVVVEAPAKKPPLTKRPSLAETRAAAKAAAAATKKADDSGHHTDESVASEAEKPITNDVPVSTDSRSQGVSADALSSMDKTSDPALVKDSVDANTPDTTSPDEKQSAPATSTSDEAIITPPTSSRRPSLAEARVAGRAAKTASVSTASTVVTSEESPESVKEATTSDEKLPTRSETTAGKAPASKPPTSSRRPSLAEAPVATRPAKGSGTDTVAKTDTVVTQRRPSLAETRAAAMKAKAAASQQAPTNENTSLPRSSSPSTASPAQQGLSALQKLLRTAQAGGVDLATALSHFDKDENGKLSYQEFTMGLHALGADLASLGPDDALATAKLLDSKNKGHISLQDFEDLVAGPDAPSVSNSITRAATKPTTDIQSEVPVKNTPRPAAAGDAKASTSRAATTSRPPVTTARRVSSSTASAPSAEATAVGKTPSAIVPAIKLPSSSSRGSAAAPSTTTSSSPQPATIDEVVAPLSGYECSYEFHSDPAIRSVEVKLRRAAIDAYSRGVFPLRIVEKFLEPSSNSGGASRAKEKKSELRRVEFLQVLMEMGFSLLSNDDHEDEEDAVDAAPRMNDHLYARQLERLARYKHHIKEESRAQRSLVRAVQKSQQRALVQAKAPTQSTTSVHRFAQDKSQLFRVLSYYRDGHKKSLVYSLLRDQVTTQVSLFPSFAALVFLELPLVNPYPHHERFRLEFVATPTVVDADIVTDSDEWQFYRHHVPLAFGDHGGKDVERDMIDPHREVVLDANDHVPIPVKLRWLQPTIASSSSSSKATTSAMSLAVRSCTHGHTVALFKLGLVVQPFVCHRVLRFVHPASSVWKWDVSCPRGKHFVCLDASVAATTTPLVDGSGSLVTIKCRVGAYPSLEEFYVVIYDDEYFARIDEVWQIRVQAAMRLDVHAALGQTVRSELVVKGDVARRPRHVRCVTTYHHAHRVSFRPGQVFQLIGDAYNRIEWRFCAVDLAAPSLCRVRVHLVDVETQELMGSWLLHVSLERPAITKAYELSLPPTQAAQKKIAYTNPWDQPQTVVLRSSDPHRLKPRDAVLAIPAHGQVFLRLIFPTVVARQDRIEARELLLFVNDQQTEQNEECLRFQVSYDYM